MEIISNLKELANQNNKNLISILNKDGFNFYDAMTWLEEIPNFLAGIYDIVFGLTVKQWGSLLKK